MAEKNVVQNETIQQLKVDEDGDVNGLIMLSELATTSTPGIASFDAEDFAIDSEGHVYLRQKVGAIQACGHVIAEEKDDFIWEISEYSPKKLRQLIPGDLILAMEEGLRTSIYDDPLVQAGEVYIIYHVVDGIVRTKKDVKFQFNYGGPQGSEGKAATIKVVETVTGEPGTDASVENLTDSVSNVELKFTIPQGKDGENATIEVGETETTDAGTEAEVTNSGTETAAILNFKIPKGDKGDAAYIKMRISEGQLWCDSYDTGLVEGFKLNSYGELLLEVNV